MNRTPYRLHHCEQVNCESGKYRAPFLLGYYMAYFISEGKGVFGYAGKTWGVGEGQCFVVCPGVSTWCQADEYEPWVFSCVGFTGPGMDECLKSWGITPESPILSFDHTCRSFYYISEILDNRREVSGATWRVVGNLLKIFGELERFAVPNGEKVFVDHVEKALRYVRENYTRPIRVKDIVEYVCLERSYFSHLFRSRLGVSPGEHLYKYRMNKASELLLNTCLSVEAVALSVGYRDPLHFSRRFRNYSGYSPRKYRQLIQC